ncbi:MULTISPECIES: ribosome maturation factor RimM [unclassified Carboxylicivirga]|uniref:ribosome maturation factor RimM n=1 Tax=Carboxylicivirga TaxID=1628153 RepID=UPI003D341A8B
MIEKHTCIQIGFVAKTHGIVGEVVVRLFDEFTIDDMLTEFLYLDLDGGLVPFYLEVAREKKQSDVLVKLEQLSDDASAARVLDAPVYVKKEGQEESSDEAAQFSAYQLVGYRCQVAGHGMMGKIVAVQNISKNPLFEIDHNGRELLIPIVDHFIAGIDDEQQIVMFDLPEGLI